MKLPLYKIVGNGYYGFEDMASNESDPPVEIPSSDIGDTATEEQVEQPATNALPDDVFAEYMWMEHEEEFDKLVLQQLEEEELMRECMEAMYADERAQPSTSQNIQTSDSLPAGNHDIEDLTEKFKRIINVEGSTLNPEAAEFVPDARTMAPNFPMSASNAQTTAPGNQKKE